MDDFHPRREVERDRLLGEGERTGDQRLRGDDRRERREHDHRPEREPAGQRVERVVERVRVDEQPRPLAQIAQRHRRKDEPVPGNHDGDAAEVREIGVERFDAGDRQHDAAEDDEAEDSVVGFEGDRVPRIERREHARVAGDPDDPGDRDRTEPERHDGPEQRSDALRPPRLDDEQPDDQGDRDGDDPGLGRGGRHPDPLDRRDDRDRRGDHPVTEEHPGPDHHDDQEPGRFPRDSPLHSGRQERQEGEDPALAVVVDPHHDAHVLEADHDDERPDDEGEDPEHVRRGRLGVRELEAGLQRVERAGPDVSEHDPEGGERNPGLELRGALE